MISHEGRGRESEITLVIIDILSVAVLPFMSTFAGTPPLDTGSGATAVSDATISPITRTAVSLEYASLRHSGHCPLGIYVVPSAENLLVWDGVFFVHQGQILVGFFLHMKMHGEFF
jgi:hypothetical protein